MQLISRENTLVDLVEFVKNYVRVHQDKYRIPLERIPAYLPSPLKTIYNEFGNFPSLREIAAGNTALPLENKRVGHLFDNQDQLVYFDYLEEENERVRFAGENQGNWKAETDTDRDDPPVYSDAYLIWDYVPGAGTIRVCDKLSHFLASFCLHELVYGSVNLYSCQEFYDETEFRKTLENCRPVWLDGAYVWHENYLSFYQTEDGILLMVADGRPDYVGSNENYDNISGNAALQNLVLYKHY